MATSRICSIPNYGKQRAKRGEAQRFFDEIIPAHEGNECLIWPFALSTTGYASLGAGVVSRLVCEERHGPPPTPDHEAAHSCGNRPCVNRRHLSWKTSKENHDDRLTHGTHSRREQNGRSKLTETDVSEIRSLKGVMSQCKLAVLYGVSQSSISLIQSGKNWPLLTLAAAALAVIFFTPPAFAATKTCVIVYSGGTDGNWQEKEEHEFAHALGWEHPNKLSTFGRAYQPPAKYKKLYRGWKAGAYEPPCNLIAHHVSVKEAKRLCDGHFGCQWFE
jgi:DNA-binding XRE family transcriptional regulator